MAAVLETIFAGGIIFQRKIGRRASRKGETKAPRVNTTPEEVQKINDHYAERTLQIKLHHNFNPGDHHLAITYSRWLPSKASAREDLRKLKRELRREYKKLGLEFKWISVTEYENRRIHHHMVVNQGVPISVIRDLWDKGYIHERPLSRSKDWRKLGTYLIKETSKTFRNPDAVGKARYSCSRNLTMPDAYKEEIAPEEIKEEPKPLKGYYIDRDSLYEGENPLTGRPYKEYVMVPLNPYKVRTRFNKKTKVPYRPENYNSWLRRNMPKQLEMDLDEYPGREAV